MLFTFVLPTFLVSISLTAVSLYFTFRKAANKNTFGYWVEIVFHAIALFMFLSIAFGILFLYLNLNYYCRDGADCA